MRILYLADIRFPLERANGIQTAETCAALAGRGHEVTLVVRPDTARPRRDPLAFYALPALPRLVIQRVRVAGPAIARRAGYLMGALWQAARRPAHDVVLTRDLGAAAALLRVPKGWRPPLVYESHGVAPVVGDLLPTVVAGARRASRAKQRRLLRRERRVWREADGYVTITAALAEDLAGRFGSRQRLATVPDGVRLPAGRTFVPPQRHAAPVVAYAGHLYPWKGVDVLLGALAGLPGMRGLVVGGHPKEGDLARTEALAATLGLGDRVTFTGWVDGAAVATHLAGADVLVLPNTATPMSARYTSPLKLFEYMAAGRPIVASDLPAIREVLADGVNACLVAPGDADALAAGIRRVLDDAALGDRIARRAFEDAAAYSWDRRAERLEDLLADVVKQP